jgi:hypothetical protein
MTFVLTLLMGLCGRILLLFHRKCLTLFVNLSAAVDKRLILYNLAVLLETLSIKRLINRVKSMIMRWISHFINFSPTNKMPPKRQTRSASPKRTRASPKRQTRRPASPKQKIQRRSPNRKSVMVSRSQSPRAFSPDCCPPGVNQRESNLLGTGLGAGAGALIGSGLTRGIGGPLLGALAGGVIGNKLQSGSRKPKYSCECP